MEKVEHFAYSPFPQFAWSVPSAPYRELSPVGLTLSLNIDSARDISRAELTLDPGPASSATAKTDGTWGYILDTKAAATGKGVVASWALPADYVLSEGTHTVVAWAINDLGLEDRATTYFYVAADTAAPVIAWKDVVNEITPSSLFVNGIGTVEVPGGAGVYTAPEAGRWFHADTLAFGLADFQSPLSSFTIFNALDEVVYRKPFYPATKIAAVSDALEHLPDGLGYKAVLADSLNNAATMYFHVDRGTPTVTVTNIVSRLKADHSGHVFDIRGTASDVTSGLDGAVFRFWELGEAAGRHSGLKWPVGGEAGSFAFNDVGTTTAFGVYDRSGWLGLEKLDIAARGEERSLQGPGLSGIAAESGLILSSAALRVYEQPMQFTRDGEEITLLETPQGMSVSVYVETGAAPAVTLPVTYGFSQANPGEVLNAVSAGFYEFRAPAAMGPGAQLRLSAVENSNFVRYSWRKLVNGAWETGISTFTPHSFTLKASATAYFSYEDLALRPLPNAYAHPGENRTFQFGDVHVEIASVTVGGPITIEQGRRTVRQPGYKMAEQNTVYEIKTTAQFTGKVTIKMSLPRNIAEQQKAGAKIFHCDESMSCVEEMTDARDLVSAIIKVDHLSPFALMIPIYDADAPQTALRTFGTRKDLAGQVWVTSETYISLQATDSALLGDISGPATTYLLINNEATPACLATPPLEGAAPGTCANNVYGGSFALPEGAHTLNYLSSDNWGNLEPAQARTFYVDATPPSAALFAGTVPVTAGGSVYIVEGDSLTLTAVDPQSNGVASGVDVRYALVDVTPEECESQNPPAACATAEYSGPFSLPTGTHTVYYSAADKVGNRAEVRSVAVNVAEQLKPPKGFLFERKYAVSANSQYYYLDMDASGNTYVGTAQNDVRRFDTAGNLTATYGSVGPGQGQFYGVSGIALGPDGNLYVADESKGNVQVFGLAGNYIRALTGFSGPTDIKFDKAGYLYVANFDTNQIVKMSTSGVVALRISASRPRGLAIDPAGNVYASNFVGNVVYKFNPSGSLLFQLSAGGDKNLYRPYGLSMDAFENLYVADMFNSRIAVYSSAGAYLGNFGTPATNPDGVLGRPAGIHVNAGTGKVFVSNYNMSNGAGEMVVYSPETLAPKIPEILSPVQGAKILAVDSILVAGRGEPGRRIELYDNSLPTGSTSVYRPDGGFYLGVPSLRGGHRLSAEAKNVFGFGSGASVEVSFDVGDLIQPAFSNPELTSINIPNFGILYGTTTIVADYNNDGNQDIVIPGMRYYKVLLGRGDGTFLQLPAVDFGDYMLVKKGAASDFNADGKPDWVAVSGDQIFAALGNGDGTFQPLKITYTYAGTTADDMEVLDFNNDDISDVVLVFGGKLESFRGNGDGTFSFVALLTAATRMSVPSIGVGDFNSDGLQDIGLIDGVYFGDGTGRFPDYKPVCGPEIQNCGKLFAGDFNQDHVKDLAFGGYNGVYNSVAVFLSDRSGGFLGPFVQASPQLAAGIPMLDDFNGDGIWDIGAGDRNGVIHILPGRGDGSFGQETSLWVGNSCSYIETLAAGDFDGDGLKDIAAALNLETSCRVADLAVFYNRTPIPDVVAPATATLTLQNTAEGQVVVQWRAPGDDGWRGQAFRYDFRRSFAHISDDAAFMLADRILAVPSPAVAGSSESVVVPGLLSGTSYYFALKTYDEAGNVSGLSNSPVLFTKYVVQSPVLVGGNPEISLVSGVPLTISTASVVSGPGGIAIGSATAQGITLGGGLYEIGPDGTYDPPIMLTFYYSTAALSAAGLREEDAFVYEHFSDSVWRPLPNQVRDLLAHKITVPVTQISSLFGIFGVARDKTAPVTGFSVSGSSWAAGGVLYTSAASSLALNAADPVVCGTASGVAFTEFRVDAGTAAPFVPYVEPFALPIGGHVLDFRSVDNAGNIEITRSTSVFMDGEPPFAGFSLAGASYAANGVIYVAGGSTLTLSAIDVASGVRALLYTINGATFSAVSSAEISLAYGGNSSISYFAVDNVGNVGVGQQLEVIVDASAPVTVADISGAEGADGWHISAVDVSLKAGDELSGVKEILFSLDGATVTAYTSSFTIAAEGNYSLAAYSVDNVINKEAERQFNFKIDTSTPAITYGRLPAANAAGWSNVPVEVVFAGTDAVSGVEYCSSSFSIVSEGKDIPVSGYCRDFAGWSSTAAFTVNIDTTPPDIAYVAEPAPNAAGWNNSDVTLRFACSDGLSGVSVCPEEIVLYGEGLGISTAVVARDYADNAWPLVAAGLNIDRTPPVSRAILDGSVNNGWYTSAVKATLLTSDALSGAAGLLYSLDGGPYESYAAPVVVGADGRHTLRYYAVDAAGNSEAGKTLSFDIDTTAPIVEISSPAVGAVFLAGQDMLNVAFAVTDALDAAPVSTAALVQVLDKGTPLGSGAANIAVVNGQAIEPLALGDGLWRLEVTAVDAAGNSTQAVSGVFEVVHDTLAPVTTLTIGAPKSGVEPVVISSVTPLLLSATDDMLLAGDGLGTGVAVTYLSLDGAVPVVAAGEFFISSEGAHTLFYYSVDKAGNTEPAHNLTVQVAALTIAREVMLNFGPSVINLKSEGQYVTATLAVSSLAGVGFAEDNVRITKVNGIAISTPVYSQAPGASGKKGKSKEKKYSISVKFDRQALIVVLPVNAVSVVTVEGLFDDETAFVAEGSLRVINPGHMGKGKGGKWKHHSRACADIGGRALKEDVEISVLNLYERASERLERDKKAAKNGFARRGEPFEFGPEGTVFEEPVEISLPYESYDAKKEKLQVAYWNPSSKDWEPLTSTLDTAEKVVKAKVGHFSLYQVVVSTIAEPRIIRPAGEQPVVGVQAAGPSAAFVLGEVYVYPNPAKGGAVPIFHLECGIADSVDIKVYTVSGREAHEATLTAMPAVIEQRYAYEYAWRGHIPSGVYLYFIEARKGGQKIKRTGKFAVVR